MTPKVFPPCRPSNSIQVEHHEELVVVADAVAVANVVTCKLQLQLRYTESMGATGGQSYKHFTSINHDSRVVI